MNFDCWTSGTWASGSWVVGSWCPSAILPIPEAGGMVKYPRALVRLEFDNEFILRDDDEEIIIMRS